MRAARWASDRSLYWHVLIVVLTCSDQSIDVFWSLWWRVLIVVLTWSDRCIDVFWSLYWHVLDDCRPDGAFYLYCDVTSLLRWSDTPYSAFKLYLDMHSSCARHASHQCDISLCCDKEHIRLTFSPDLRAWLRVWICARGFSKSVQWHSLQDWWDSQLIRHNVLEIYVPCSSAHNTKNFRDYSKITTLLRILNHLQWRTSEMMSDLLGM